MTIRKHPLTAYREARSDKPSPEKVGDELGVSGLTVRRWEAGKALPQDRHRPKILEVTGLRFSEFVAFHEGEMAA